MLKAPTVMYEEDDLVGTPEQKLCAAILERAVLDATDNARVCTEPRAATDKRKHKREALEWLFCEIEVKPASFAWVCEALNLDCEEVRQHVRGFIREKTKLIPTDIRNLAKAISAL